MQTYKEVNALVKHCRDVNNQIIEVGDTVAHISGILGRAPLSCDGNVGRGVVVAIKQRVSVRFPDGSRCAYSPSTLRIIKKRKVDEEYRVLGKL